MVALGNTEVVLEKEGGFAFFNANRSWGYFATAQDMTSSQLQLSTVELAFAGGVQATMTIPRLTTYPNLGRASQGASHAALPLVSFLGTTLGRIVAVTYAASTGSDPGLSAVYTPVSASAEDGKSVIGLAFQATTGTNGTLFLMHYSINSIYSVPLSGTSAVGGLTIVPLSAGTNGQLALSPLSSRLYMANSQNLYEYSPPGSSTQAQTYSLGTLGSWHQLGIAPADAGETGALVLDGYSSSGGSAVTLKLINTATGGAVTASIAGTANGFCSSIVAGRFSAQEPRVVVVTVSYPNYASPPEQYTYNLTDLTLAAASPTPSVSATSSASGSASSSGTASSSLSASVVPSPSSSASLSPSLSVSPTSSASGSASGSGTLTSSGSASSSSSPSVSDSASGAATATASQSSSVPGSQSSTAVATPLVSASLSSSEAATAPASVGVTTSTSSTPTSPPSRSSSSSKAPSPAGSAASSAGATTPSTPPSSSSASLAPSPSGPSTASRSVQPSSLASGAASSPASPSRTASAAGSAASTVAALASSAAPTATRSGSAATASATASLSASFNATAGAAAAAGLGPGGGGSASGGTGGTSITELPQSGVIAASVAILAGLLLLALLIVLVIACVRWRTARGRMLALRGASLSRVRLVQRALKAQHCGALASTPALLDALGAVLTAPEFPSAAELNASVYGALSAGGTNIGGVGKELHATHGPTSVHASAGGSGDLGEAANATHPGSAAAASRRGTSSPTSAGTVARLRYGQGVPGGSAGKASKAQVALAQQQHAAVALPADAVLRARVTELTPAVVAVMLRARELIVRRGGRLEDIAELSSSDDEDDSGDEEAEEADDASSGRGNLNGGQRHGTASGTRAPRLSDAGRSGTPAVQSVAPTASPTLSAASTLTLSAGSCGTTASRTATSASDGARSGLGSDVSALSIGGTATSSAASDSAAGSAGNRLRRGGSSRSSAGGVSQRSLTGGGCGPMSAAAVAAAQRKLGILVHSMTDALPAAALAAVVHATLLTVGQSSMQPVHLQRLLAVSQLDQARGAGDATQTTASAAGRSSQTQGSSAVLAALVSACAAAAEDALFGGLLQPPQHGDSGMSGGRKAAHLSQESPVLSESAAHTLCSFEERCAPTVAGWFAAQASVDGAAAALGLSSEPLAALPGSVRQLLQAATAEDALGATRVGIGGGDAAEHAFAAENLMQPQLQPHARRAGTLSYHSRVAATAGAATARGTLSPAASRGVYHAASPLPPATQAATAAQHRLQPLTTADAWSARTGSPPPHGAVQALVIAALDASARTAVLKVVDGLSEYDAQTAVLAARAQHIRGLRGDAPSSAAGLSAAVPATRRGSISIAGAVPPGAGGAYVQESTGPASCRAAHAAAGEAAVADQRLLHLMAGMDVRALAGGPRLSWLAWSLGCAPCRRSDAGSTDGISATVESSGTGGGGSAGLAALARNLLLRGALPSLPHDPADEAAFERGVAALFRVPWATVQAKGLGHLAFSTATGTPADGDEGAPGAVRAAGRQQPWLPPPSGGAFGGSNPLHWRRRSASGRDILYTTARLPAGSPLAAGSARGGVPAGTSNGGEDRAGSPPEAVQRVHRTSRRGSALGSLTPSLAPIPERSDALASLSEGLSAPHSTSASVASGVESAVVAAAAAVLARDAAGTSLRDLQTEVGLGTRLLLDRMAASAARRLVAADAAGQLDPRVLARLSSADAGELRMAFTPQRSRWPAPATAAAGSGKSRSVKPGAGDGSVLDVGGAAYLLSLPQVYAQSATALTGYTPAVRDARQLIAAALRSSAGRRFSRAVAAPVPVPTSSGGIHRGGPSVGGGGDVDMAATAQALRQYARRHPQSGTVSPLGSKVAPASGTLPHGAAQQRSPNPHPLQGRHSLAAQLSSPPGDARRLAAAGQPPRDGSHVPHVSHMHHEAATVPRRGSAAISIPGRSPRYTFQSRADAATGDAAAQARQHPIGNPHASARRRTQLPSASGGQGQGPGGAPGDGGRLLRLSRPSATGVTLPAASPRYSGSAGASRRSAVLDGGVAAGGALDGPGAGHGEGDAEFYGASQ